MALTVDQFRRLALDLADVAERSHVRHPDFRVRGKIFATLGYPTAEWGTVKLTPMQQGLFLRAQPDAFVPAGGAWGRSGFTSVRLAKASKTEVQRALRIAWENVALQRRAR